MPPSPEASPAPEPPAPARAPKPESAASTSWTDRLLVASAALGTGFLLLQILSFGYGRDQGIYAMVGKAILEGKMPYRDAWDFKPPGIFLLYALSRALFGASQTGIRALEVIGLVLMIAAMVRLSRVWWGDGRIGWIGGFVAVLVHAELDFWHTAQPESFGGMFTIAALLASASDKRWRHVLAGALLGFAGLLKPPLAGGGVVLAFALAWSAYSARPDASPRVRWRAALRPIGDVLAGGVSPFALCLLWFAAKGALGELWDVLFVFTPHYTALSWKGESLWGMSYCGFTEWLTGYAAPPTVGFLLLLALGPERRERRGVFVVGGIIAVHVVGVIMQGKFFPYHYGATWPLTALLAGLGMHKAWAFSSRRGAPGVALFYAAFAATALAKSATKDTPDSFGARCEKRMRLFTSSPRDQAGIDALASIADVDAGANRRVAELLRERTPPGAPVLVFGFEPVIYDLADRPPASRFIYDVPQRVAWAKDRMRETMMRDLAAAPPAAIVVERNDVFPAVTGEAIGSADAMLGFPALRELVETRYQKAAVIEDFEIYLAN